MSASTIECRKKNFAQGSTLILCLSIIILFVIDFESTGRYVYEGIYFTVKCIIPSLFPYMIITNVLIMTDSIKQLCTPIEWIMEKAGINSYSARVFICSVLCGAPIGAISIKRLYDSGDITKKEADVLLSSLPPAGAAFVILAVGAGILRSFYIGTIMWVFFCIYSFLYLLILMPRKNSSRIRIDRSDDVGLIDALNESLKKSTASIINVSSVIIFFYTVTHTISEIMNSSGINRVIVSIVCSLLEMGAGCKSVESLPILKNEVCAFALGFGGISILMQVKGEGHDNSSASTYLISKLISGIASSIFVYWVL